MPQASDDLRAQWGGCQGVGDDKATGYLIDNGWQLTPQFTWVKPFPDYEPTEDDLGAIHFLMCEWDFGGIEQVVSFTAQGTEAGTAKTVEQGLVNDGPVGETDAPKGRPS